MFCCCGCYCRLQIQSWTYSAKTRTIRASARSARDAGVRVRELRPEELTPEMRRRLQQDVSGGFKVGGFKSVHSYECLALLSYK